MATVKMVKTKILSSEMPRIFRVTDAGGQSYSATAPKRRMRTLAPV